MQSDNGIIPPRYDYTQAGFDSFLSRSIDSQGQNSLGVPLNQQSRAIAFDRSQVSGVFGDTARIGRINLEGANGAITVDDGDNVFFLVGDDGG